MNSKALKLSCGAALLLLGSLSLLVFLYIADLSKQLPSEPATLERLTNSSLSLASEVFDRKGRKIGEFVSEKRYFIPYSEIPIHVVHAFLSAEDKNFFKHRGVSPTAILRAAIANLKSGRIRQGASTITQQLARIYFLNKEKSFSRKIKEAMLALAIEKKMSKEKIFELYVNRIFLGNQSFGIEAASRNYFHKSAKKLTIGEAALLASLPKAPTYYAIHKNYSRAVKRQRLILRRMLKNGHISKRQYRTAIQTKVKYFKKRKNYGSFAKYFIEEVKKAVGRKFEAKGILKTEGLKIYTTLDFDTQRAAEKTFREEISRLNNPVGRSESKPAPKNKRRKRLEGALVSVNPDTGAILALQGGQDFRRSQFNRAFRTRRELGDIFLPIFVSSGIDTGYTLSTPVDLEPMEARGRRYSHSIFPTVYEVMTQNDRDNAVVLFAALGVGTVAKFSHQLGFRFKVFDLRMALGRGKASPVKLAKAYSVFASSGNQINPYLINKIKDSKGQLIYRKKHYTKERLIKPETSTIMTKVLQDSVNFGYAKSFKNGQNNLALASGFSKDLKNGWAVGYRPGILTSLWIGAENGRVKLGKTRAESTKELSQVWKKFEANLTIKSLHSLAKSQSETSTSNISFYQVDVETLDGKLVKRTLPFEYGTSPPQSVNF